MTYFGLALCFAPLARAAAALAGLVLPLLASPPNRPKATAAGFLRRAIGIPLRGFQRQLGETLRDLVHGLPVAVGDRDGAGFHELSAAVFDGGLGVGHGQIMPKALWVVKWA
jgi:hypothetical protein